RGAAALVHLAARVRGGAAGARRRAAAAARASGRRRARRGCALRGPRLRGRGDRVVSRVRAAQARWPRARRLSLSGVPADAAGADQRVSRPRASRRARAGVRDAPAGGAAPGAARGAARSARGPVGHELRVRHARGRIPGVVRRRQGRHPRAAASPVAPGARRRRARLPLLLRRRAASPLQGAARRGQARGDRQRARRQPRTAAALDPHAGAARPRRRGLLRAARDAAAATRDRALSRPRARDGRHRGLGAPPGVRWPAGFERVPDEDWTRQPLDTFGLQYDTVEQHGWYRNLDPTVEDLARHLDEGQILVDYSGGTGILLDRLLLRVFDRQVGMLIADSSPKFLRVGLDKFRDDERVAVRLLRWLQEDRRLELLHEALGPELSTRGVDAIASTNAIHLYLELPQTLASWARVLRPGGRAFVQSGNI